MVLSASNRALSESRKVSEWLVTHTQNLGFDAKLLDLYQEKLPLYDDSDPEELSDQIVRLKYGLQESDAFVFVSPEWNGMMSLSLPNMLHYIEQEMAHKPVMLVGVSSGRGGTYPIAQMRLMGHKNRHYVISPESLIVSGVKTAFNDYEWLDSTPDIQLKRRADYALKVLIKYAEALRIVRESDVIDLKNFENGV